MIRVDLRSDTVTRPGEAMLRAMGKAEVGDDVYREDPSVNALEEQVADLLGKEAALFVPSGTMANQIALALHAGPGDEVILEAGAHPFRFEGGGTCRSVGHLHHAGAGAAGHPECVQGAGGHPTAELW